jgi:uncharacterized protein
MKYRLLPLAVFLSAVMAAGFFLGKSAGMKDLVTAERKESEASPGIIPSDTALLALVIDDLGYTRKNFKGLEKLGVPLTLAVLPGLRFSDSACELARLNGLEVILHLPMEPRAETWAREKNTVMAGMESEEVEAILNEALGSVKGASGVSNHMGSRATGDRKAVTALMDSLKKRGLFFLDSASTSDSVCDEVAAHYGVPYFKRDVFLDNDVEYDYIIGKIREAGNIALARGRAIAIGHDKETTIKAIEGALPWLEEKGIRLCTLTGKDGLDANIKLDGR